MLCTDYLCTPCLITHHSNFHQISSLLTSKVTVTRLITTAFILGILVIFLDDKHSHRPLYLPLWGAFSLLIKQISVCMKSICSQMHRWAPTDKSVIFTDIPQLSFLNFCIRPTKSIHPYKFPQFTKKPLGKNLQFLL
jgi:hypothetical protein